MPELRDLPAVDTLLTDPSFKSLVDRHGVQAVRDQIRQMQSKIRSERSVPQWAVIAQEYAQLIDQSLSAQAYTPVFNVTGTVIHTNLGRSLISPDTWSQIAPLITRPMNLEYDLQAGRRGDRDAIVEARICRLTGCEAATIVNNNAAALMLCLNTFAQGKKVPVSRGELIEIGGSFRLPELMARSGCELIEVGTTNRTHGKDFEAVLDQAAMLLKVHPSNYFIGGFSKEVDAAELAKLAKRQGIPSCVDLGSGTLVDLTRWGLPAEPTPQSVLTQGIDLVTFSGDKLLGGTQAGIIAGSQSLLAEIKKNPMKRAMRADKITLALLDATLKLYEVPEELPQHLPLLKTLTLDATTLEHRAQQVSTALSASYLTAIEKTQAQIGSGALPDKTIESVAVTLQHASLSAEEIESKLRALPTPVIARIQDEKVWLDMRGVEPMDSFLDQLPLLTS